MKESQPSEGQGAAGGEGDPKSLGAVRGTRAGVCHRARPRLTSPNLSSPAEPAAPGQPQPGPGPRPLQPCPCPRPSRRCPGPQRCPGRAGPGWAGARPRCPALRCLPLPGPPGAPGPPQPPGPAAGRGEGGRIINSIVFMQAGLPAPQASSPR